MPFKIERNRDLCLNNFGRLVVAGIYVITEMKISVKTAIPVTTTARMMFMR